MRKDYLKDRKEKRGKEEDKILNKRKKKRTRKQKQNGPANKIEIKKNIEKK